MAAFKENHYSPPPSSLPSASASASSSSASASLRTPLSPIHHNCLPPPPPLPLREHSTTPSSLSSSSRRLTRENPKLSIPRTPLPTPAGRAKLLREASIDPRSSRASLKDRFLHLPPPPPTSFVSSSSSFSSVCSYSSSSSSSSFSCVSVSSVSSSIVMAMRSKASAPIPPRPQRLVQAKPLSHDSSSSSSSSSSSTVMSNTISGGSDQRCGEAHSGDGDGGGGGDGDGRQEDDNNNKRKSCRRKWRRIPREAILKSLRGEMHGCDDRKIVPNPNPNSNHIPVPQENQTGKNANPNPTPICNSVTSMQEAFIAKRENPNPIASTQTFFTGRKENPISTKTISSSRRGNLTSKAIAMKQALVAGKKENLNPIPIGGAAAPQKIFSSKKANPDSKPNSFATQNIFTGKKEKPNPRFPTNAIFTGKKEGLNPNLNLGCTAPSLNAVVAESILEGKKQSPNSFPAITKPPFESKKSRYPREGEKDHEEAIATHTQSLHIPSENIVKPKESICLVEEAVVELPARSGFIQNGRNSEETRISGSVSNPTLNQSSSEKAQDLRPTMSCEKDKSFAQTPVPTSCDIDKTLTPSLGMDQVAKSPTNKDQISTSISASSDTGQTLNVTLTPLSGHRDQTLTLTPPQEKSFNLKSPGESKQTPPLMQTTQSPDFVKRDGMRALLPIDADNCCYAAAPCGLVKDRRKCKPMGVLTVDGMTMGQETPEMTLPGFVNVHDECDGGNDSSVGVGVDVDVDDDDDVNDDMTLPTMLLPTPAVASVEWMLEGNEKLDVGNVQADLNNSPCFRSAESNDLCRMSFPRMSPPQIGAPLMSSQSTSFMSPLQTSTSVMALLQKSDSQMSSLHTFTSLHNCTCDKVEAFLTNEEHRVDDLHPEGHQEGHEEMEQRTGKEKERQSAHTSISVSGYEWSAVFSASSSQGAMIHSSQGQTEVSPGNPRRSIVFTDESSYGSPKFRSNVVNNILFDNSTMEEYEQCSGFSDDESIVYPFLQDEMKESLERSPPFEYSVMKSFNHKDLTKVRYDDNDFGVVDDCDKKSTWAKCLPEEVSVSISGPLNSSFLSSQEHDLANETPGYPAGQALVCFQGENKALHKEQKKAMHIAAELYNATAVDGRGGDISSRIAMARFLCNITATYLDDIASCLVTGCEDGIGKENITNELLEFNGLRNEHFSMLAGTKKIAECCSLLQGLSLLEASNSGPNKGLLPELKLRCRPEDGHSDIV